MRVFEGNDNNFILNPVKCYEEDLNGKSEVEFLKNEDFEHGLLCFHTRMRPHCSIANDLVIPSVVASDKCLYDRGLLEERLLSSQYSELKPDKLTLIKNDKHFIPIRICLSGAVNSVLYPPVRIEKGRALVLFARDDNNDSGVIFVEKNIVCKNDYCYGVIDVYKFNKNKQGDDPLIFTEHYQNMQYFGITAKSLYERQGINLQTQRTCPMLSEIHHIESFEKAVRCDQRDIALGIIGYQASSPKSDSLGTMNICQKKRTYNACTWAIALLKQSKILGSSIVTYDDRYKFESSLVKAQDVDRVTEQNPTGSGL
tara:strand:- start:737 stop:1675 length:939 start_codon:yes stop_codon:yes gene_type:complete